MWASIADDDRIVTSVQKVHTTILTTSIQEGVAEETLKQKCGIGVEPQWQAVGVRAARAGLLL
jgi:hypothetical protein